MNPEETSKAAHFHAQKALRAVWKTFHTEFKTARVAVEEGRDIKLDADLKLHSLLISELKPSGWNILSEEDPEKSWDQSTPTWIIDPLDGSFNFSREFPFYACSIALTQGHTPLYGTILDLTNGSILHSETPLNTLGKIKALDKAVLATGFPIEFDFQKKTQDLLIFYSQFKKIRMIGSAASSLSLVAKGTFDVYYEDNIYFWDVAAGLAIIKAAGGTYKCQFDKTKWKLKVVAGNSSLVELIHL